MRNSRIYRTLISYYGSLLEAYRYIFNSKYRKVVMSLLVKGDLQEKISKLDYKFNHYENNTYYIIRRDNPSIGLLTFVSVFLGHIAYAIQKGYIPIIDMKNFKSIYLDNEEVGKKNAWEYYFEQPYNIGLDDLKEGDKVIFSPKYTQPISPFMNSLFDTNESLFWKSIAERFIRLNQNTDLYVKNEFNALLGKKKILGLLYRGTDYLLLKPKNHPIQPSIDLFVQTVEKSIKDWGPFDGYYLATDDERAFLVLSKKFPNMIIVNSRKYYDNFNNIKFLAEAKFDRDNDAYLKGLEYLSSIKLLSNSDSIIASGCAGTYATNFFRAKEFSNTHFFNLGFY